MSSGVNMRALCLALEVTIPKQEYFLARPVGGLVHLY